MKYPLLPFIVTAIAAVSFCSSPPARTDSAGGAADTQHRGRYKYVTPAEGLRLREGPDLKARTIMSLPFNSRVKVIETTRAVQEIGEISAGWTKAEFAMGNRNVTGWMYDGYLSFQRALPPSLYGEFAVHKCYPAKGWETSAVDYGSKMTGKQYFTGHCQPESGMCPHFTGHGFLCEASSIIIYFAIKLNILKSKIFLLPAQIHISL